MSGARKESFRNSCFTAIKEGSAYSAMKVFQENLTLFNFLFVTLP